MRWYEDKDGNTSSMRIIAMTSTVVGSIVVLSCVVAMFLRIPEAVAIAGVGGAMTGLGEFAKAWQSKSGG
jgi:hypothetical protein